MAHLTTNPAAAAAVGRALERQPPSGRGFQRLADALARAGTEAAQAALTAAADRSGQDGRTATLLTVHQGMARAPGALLEASLRRKAAAPGDAQSTAQLALGVVASRLAGTDPARHGALVADLAARYRAANTDAARVHWLHVLGNTASPEVARIAA